MGLSTGSQAMHGQFSELELQGWQNRAAPYEAIPHKMTHSTIPGLNATVGDADARYAWESLRSKRPSSIQAVQDCFCSRAQFIQVCAVSCMPDG